MFTKTYTRYPKLTSVTPVQKVLLHYKYKIKSSWWTSVCVCVCVWRGWLEEVVGKSLNNSFQNMEEVGNR